MKHVCFTIFWNIHRELIIVDTIDGSAWTLLMFQGAIVCQKGILRMSNSLARQAIQSERSLSECSESSRVRKRLTSISRVPSTSFPA